jgi:hypothetical protein
MPSVGSINFNGGTYSATANPNYIEFTILAGENAFSLIINLA